MLSRLFNFFQNKTGKDGSFFFFFNVKFSFHKFLKYFYYNLQSCLNRVLPKQLNKALSILYCPTWPNCLVIIRNCNNQTISNNKLQLSSGHSGSHYNDNFYLSHKFTNLTNSKVHKCTTSQIHNFHKFINSQVHKFTS